MKKSQRIILLSLIFSLSAVLAMANGQQEAEDMEQGAPPRGDEQSMGQEMGLPSSGELTLLRLQYFAENADYEPTLALSDEQVKFILPILEDWSAAVEEDEAADSEAFVEGINEVLTSEQSSYMPPPPQALEDSGDGRPERGERPPQGERPEDGDRPAPPQKPSISEMLVKLTDTLTEMN